MSNEINNTPSNTTLNAVIAEALEQQKKRADVLELALTEAEEKIGRGREAYETRAEQVRRLREELTEVEGKVKEFEEALTASKNREEFLAAAVNKWSRSWEAVREQLTEFFEDGVLMAGSRLDDYLIEEFEIQTEEEVEVTLTITYSGKVTIPKGADLGNLVMESEPDYDVNLVLEGDTIGNLTFDRTEYDY